MSTERPREWWIVDGCGVAPLYDNEDEAIRAAGYSAEQEPTFTYHVIEKSAYDAVMAERDELERHIGEHGCDIVAVTKERDALTACLDEILSYMPKVPTEPYERELARKLQIAREALEQVKVDLQEDVNSFTIIEKVIKPALAKLDATVTPGVDE